jgi:hypothetical protein
MTERYVVVDQDGWKINTIIYSLESHFTLEEGLTLEPESESTALPKPLPEPIPPIEE